MTAQGDHIDDGETSIQEDAVLIRAVRSGDRNAYDELWRRHSRAAIGIVRPLAHSDTEDVVAEAFTSIWEQLQRGVGPSDKFRPYLLKVARNIAVRFYREHQRQLTNIEFEGDPVAGSDEFSARHEDRREILAAFTELPERWRQVLWLTEIEEMSRPQIAEQLNLSPNAVSVMARRAKEGLRLAWLRRQLPPREAIEHPAFVQSLPNFVRGTLSSQRTRELRSHLSSCPSCAKLLVEVRAENQRLGGRKRIALLLSGSLVFGAGIAQGVPGQPANALSHSPGFPERHRAPAGHSIISGVPAAIGGAVAAAILLGAFVLSMMPSHTPIDPNDSVRAEVSNPVSTEASGRSGHADQNPGGSATRHETTGLSDGERPEATQWGANTIERESEGSETGSTREFTGAFSEKPFDPEDPDIPTLSVRAVDSRGGSVAPRLVGEAQPGSSLVVVVANQRTEIRVDGQGQWSTDLASLPLPTGSHEAIVSQPDLPAVAPQQVPFTLALPQAALDTWPTNGADPPTAFPPFLVTFTGIPGAEVCPRPYSQMWGPITLDSTGHAATPMFYAWPFQSFGFGYCHGDRLGPSSAIPTETGSPPSSG